MAMIFPGREIGACMRARSAGTTSSPGSGLPPCSMNSTMLGPPRGLISPSSRDPTRGSPPSTEYVTSFKGSPLPLFQTAAIRILAARRGFSLRLQTLYLPPSLGTAVDEPVVQPVFASLPELDNLGLDPVAAPEKGAWDLTPLVFRLQRLYPLFEDAPVLYGSALLRGPSSQTTPAWTAQEVGVGLLSGEAARAALDPDLPLKLAPVEQDGAQRVRLEFAGLASLVVGVEDETPFV